MRTETLDYKVPAHDRGTSWTADRLRACVASTWNGSRIVVIANREPIRHEWDADRQIIARRSASGLVTALEPIVAACQGVWVAHGGGSADRHAVGRHDGLEVPKGRSAYRLRRVWLSDTEQRRYYGGFANEGLWPLCHDVHVPPVFRVEDFAAYARVNARFAAVACEEADGPAPLLLVQDYHFALAPKIIRERLPRASVVMFWHIPWPVPGQFDTCPWNRQLLRGMLGSRIIGFHTDLDVQNFLDTVEGSLDAHVDRDRGVITFGGFHTLVRAYPISIQWPSQAVVNSPPVESCRASIRGLLNLPVTARLVVGVDRLDYTKGLCEKALAIERLLETYPEFRHDLTFVQIAEPSRQDLPAYRDVRARLQDIVERVNRRFGTETQARIVLRERHHEPEEVHEFLRSADLCYVGSLRDGMNLVAKEFVASRDDERGVLVLSAFTGAAHQLTGALLVNPYSVDDAAHVLARGLHMSPSEQSARMQAMRSVVAQFNSYWWAGQMLQDAATRRLERNALSARRMAMRRLAV